MARPGVRRGRHRDDDDRDRVVRTCHDSEPERLTADGVDMAERKTKTGSAVTVLEGGSSRTLRARPSIGVPVKAAERRMTAVKLRKAGVTYQAIADELGVTRQAAHKMVKETLEDWNQTTREEAEAVRQLELERLDQMQVGLWPAAIAGDTRAVESVLKVMDRRARLLGLDEAVVLPEGMGLAEVVVRYVESFRTD